MSPKITLHSSASSPGTLRPWSTLDQASLSVSPPARNVEMPVSENDEVSETDEASPEEVDELDESDSGEKDDAQPQWETISVSQGSLPPSKAAVKRQRPKPPTTRIPGQTIVPMSRIDAILSADVGQNGISSKETSFLVSLATEEFIRRLTRAAHSRSRLDGRALTTYNDIADTAYYFDEYKFLQEMIPRSMPLKAALAERKRILEEQEALLHCVGVDRADPAGANHYRIDQISASASSSKASSPIPRLTKRSTPSTSTNGKAPPKSRNAPTDTSPPVIRSERQKNKKARLAAEAVEANARGHMAPPPSPAVRGNGPEETVFVNGSTPPVSKSGTVKIKIPPRMSSGTPPASARVESTLQPGVLTLGPRVKPPLSSSRGSHTSRGYSPHRNGDSIVFEEDSKSGVAGSHINGKPGNVQFAPVGVDASDQPLWTRVPLPPPPSTKIGKASTENAKGRSMLTDLDAVAEQAKCSKESKVQSVREHEDVPSVCDYPQDESKPTEYTNGVEPPAKRPRQRQRSGNSVPSKGSLRDVLNGTFPNTGRTIYSQR